MQGRDRAGRTLWLAVVLAVVLAVGIHTHAFGECLADVDGDGVVDGSDVAVLADEFGTTECFPADLARGFNHHNFSRNELKLREDAYSRSFAVDLSAADQPAPE